MNLRNQKVTVEKDLLINLDPRIYEAMRNSSSISSKCSLHSVHFSIEFVLTLISSLAQKGIGAQMLKAGQKRRRTKAEIKGEKELEAQKRMKIDEKL
jgi:hypothetical protein